MTETRLGLDRLIRPHARARALAAGLAGAGFVLACVAFGLALSPRPGAVLGAWLAALACTAAAAWAVRTVGRGTPGSAASALVERCAGARAGSVAGAAAGSAVAGTSAALFAAADARAAAVVAAAAPAVSRLLGRGTRRSLVTGGVVAVLGVSLFGAAGPGDAASAAFWHPLRTWRDGRAPVRIAVDRQAVRRGDSVSVTIAAAGATHAELWTRGPGEAWRATAVPLDDAGQALRRVGPLEADLFLKAAAGGRSSAELRVTVALPLFVSALELTARFPDYLSRPDEPVVPGPDTVLLPVGTRVAVRGEASAALRAARWESGGGAATLGVSDRAFRGTLAPAQSGTWTLVLDPVDQAAPVEPPPPLVLRLVADSAPVVAVPVPGRDTTAPLTLRQPLVIDARDDHGVARVAIVSWRVSQTGRVDAPVREEAAADAGDRVIVQGELALEQRGLLPGDTLRFYVEATDNAPNANVGRSPEYALRLPSRAELRAAAREAAAALAQAADSVAGAQGRLADEARDVAAERARDPARGAGAPPATAAPRGALPFRASERATEIARQQEQLAERAGSLAEDVDELAQAVERAGLADSAFVARLAEVQRLLERAVTPELERRLRELQDALARLDPEATRQALQRLAELQRELRDELARSGELFRRAAAEGALSSLAQDAEELARRQAEWAAREALRADSAAAAAERALRRAADSLAAELAQTARDLADSVAADSTGILEPTQSELSEARGAMRGAEREAAAGRGERASQLGQQAAAGLDSVAGALRRQRDSLSRAWRQEAVNALDRALAETAALAERQEAVADALRRGETGANTRARQGSVEDGLAAVERQVREAAGRNALVSPQLETALGFAQRQMRGARQQLEQAEPNGPAAQALAEEALDALNATAHALARTRGAVAGAQSGSGFQEAVEQLARLAGQQQGMAGDAQGLLPMMGQGGAAVMQQLRALAARQRALAEQLERLQASDGDAGAGALAAEARELARQLDAGRLDRRTIERQEQLYRRLLDAGRTLSGEEPDPERERTSRTARDAARRPPPLAPGATGAGPRVRYPTWDDLRGLTPEERRLVLEYFHRLNAPPPPDR